MGLEEPTKANVADVQAAKPTTLMESVCLAQLIFEARAQIYHRKFPLMEAKRPAVNQTLLAQEVGPCVGNLMLDKI